MVAEYHVATPGPRPTPARAPGNSGEARAGGQRLAVGEETEWWVPRMLFLRLPNLVDGLRVDVPVHVDAALMADAPVAHVAGSSGPMFNSVAPPAGDPYTTRSTGGKQRSAARSAEIIDGVLDADHEVVDLAGECVDIAVRRASHRAALHAAVNIGEVSSNLERGCETDKRYVVRRLG